MVKIGRLSGEEDFKILFRRGRRVETPLFSAVLRPNGLSVSRFAFVASRAAERRAVRRNRLRRMAREWVRKNFHGSGSGRQHADGAIIFKRPAFSAKNNEFYENLERAFRRLDR